MNENQLNLLKANGIDVDAALKRFAGKSELLKKFILKFLSDKSYDTLVEALANGDAEASFMAAHTLKGVASNLALDPLYKVAEEVTEILRPKAADCIEPAKAHMDELSSVYDKMIEIITQIAD